MQEMFSIVSGSIKRSTVKNGVPHLIYVQLQCMQQNRQQQRFVQEDARQGAHLFWTLSEPRDSIGVTGRQKAVHQTCPVLITGEHAGWLCSLVGSAFLQALLSEEESLSRYCLQAYSCAWERIRASYGCVSTNTHHKMKHTSGPKHLLAGFFHCWFYF